MTLKSIKNHINNLPLLISCLFIFLCSCNSISQNSEAKNGISSQIINSPNESSLFEDKNQIQSINFKGISLQNKIPLVSGMEASELPAILLEYETDKPDNIEPRHISIKFNGEYPKQRKEYFFSPNVRIYPIAEFRQAFAVSKSLMKGFDEEIDFIQYILSRKPLKIKRIPFIPFIDLSSSLTAHLKYVSFKNGEGFFYLAQFNSQETTIDNQGLSYVFQGLTYDKKYYILATFSITSKALEENDLANKFGGFESLNDIYNTKTFQLSKKYKKYIASVETLLNQQKANDFTPDLNKIEETLASLEVNWKD